MIGIVVQFVLFVEVLVKDNTSYNDAVDVFDGNLNLWSVDIPIVSLKTKSTIDPEILLFNIFVVLL